jgi:N-acetylneuraminic acid mutarotase
VNGYLSGDLNEDCKINFVDFALMAENWLVDCNVTPGHSSCFHRWEAEPPMYTARDQFAGGVIGGKIYVFGGNGNPDQVNLKSTEVLDPNGDWGQLADNNHNDGWGVEELTGAVVDGNLYVFGAWGGIGPGGYYGVFNFNEMYDPVTDTWTTLAQKPTTVTSAPTTVYNNEIYIFGGYFDSNNPSQNHVPYDVVEKYNPSNDTWQFVTNMPKTIESFALATVGTKAYLFGGGDSATEQLFDDVITYDFQTDLWTTTGYQPMPVKKGFVYSAPAPVIDGKVYLIGGMEEIGDGIVLSSRVDIYDTVSNTWQIGPSLPLPQDDFVALTLNGKIYVVGGDNGNDFMNRAKAEVLSLSIQ